MLLPATPLSAFIGFKHGFHTALDNCWTTSWLNHQTSFSFSLVPLLERSLRPHRCCWVQSRASMQTFAHVVHQSTAFNDLLKKHLQTVYAPLVLMLTTAWASCSSGTRESGIQFQLSTVVNLLTIPRGFPASRGSLKKVGPRRKKSLLTSRGIQRGISY